MKRSKLISEAMKDEAHAPIFYHRLLKTVKTKREKGIIKGIIRDERKHLRKLRRIK